MLSLTHHWLKGYVRFIVAGKSGKTSIDLKN